jgi:alkanesulfonate monooxygenase SsuD/methylene tetrahydromethanopterin reductase-like flavin-dependent oxidoreductase (luciferase family)
MTADTLAELHEMAERIGLKRAWFQEHPRFPHYDLTRNKRRMAVKCGAIEQRRPVKAQ